MKKKLTDIVKRHPLPAFFALTFAISWGLWFVFQPVYLSGKVSAAPFIMLGIFGPALAAITLSALDGPGPRQGSRKASCIAFILLWPAGTLLFTMDQVYSEGRSLSPFLVAVSAVAALLPAFVLAKSLYSSPGVQRCLATITRPRGLFYSRSPEPGRRGVHRWYFLALAVFPVLWGLGLFLTRALGMPMPRIGTPSAGAVLQAFFYTLVFTGFAEEPGWRGFALPRLQARFSPLAASLVLGVFWAVWHAPARFGGIEDKPLADTLIEFVLIILLTVLFTWLYNRTGSSILATMLLHTSMNTATKFLPLTIIGLLLLAAFLVFIVIHDRMRQKGIVARS
jgi:membrane protease YdiL (CAAX protease family)